MTAAIAGLLHAQTNETRNTNTSTNVNTNAVNQILALVTTNAPTAKPEPSEIVIEPDGPATFEQVGNGFRVVYRDHVRVNSPQLKLWCEWLAADIPESSGQPTNIVAETNVVFDATWVKGEKMHGTSDKAVYAFSIQNGVTNATVTLTGDAEVDYKGITNNGDSIILDLIHQTMNIPTNPKTFISGNFTGKLPSTNSPIVETNLPPTAATNLSGMDTNFPPGKLDLIHKPTPPPKNF